MIDHLTLVALVYALAGLALVAAQRAGPARQRLRIADLRPGWQDFTAELRRSFRRAFADRSALAWLATVTLLGILLRAWFLNQPVRSDEASTFLSFANDWRSLFHYERPNNHVLHTLLVWATTRFLGGHPVVIRLPAFVAGIAMIPLVFWVCRTLDGRRHAGWFAAALTAVWPYLVYYSCLARGYTLLLLLTLLLIPLLRRAADAPTWFRCGTAAAIAALGALTVPTMMFHLAGLYLWATLLALRGRDVRTIAGQFVLPLCLLTGLFTFLLYTPALVVTALREGSLDLLFRNEYVVPLPWPRFLARLGPHLLKTHAFVTSDVPAGWQYLLAGFTMLGLVRAGRERNGAAFLLLPALCAGAAAILFARHAVPYVRTWNYFLPVLFIAADAGFAWVVERFPRAATRPAPAVVLAAGFMMAGHLIATRAFDRYLETGHCPEARRIVDFLAPRLRTNDWVRARFPVASPVRFYCRRRGLPDPVRPPVDRLGAEYLIEKRYYYRIEEIDPLPRPVELLWQWRDTRIYRVLPAPVTPAQP